ncbi:type II toxin-antitoxin system death-on-curing family toxin [Rhizobium leguminosarum]|uniref:Death-on-curing family protein n=1 Tax=Rhizobium leguminosarum TaxID=384 RepID=A0A2Z4YJX5_RHILE|nr:type II toxin-antitoxin system death-on-curing family toxin [Rhizobium leguminosarum]AXA41737.1 death-on-curing family protein [Rhizobium leguminosarum]
MSKDPRWVTAEQVIALNEVIVQSTGEKHFVRDEASLDGALNRPLSYYQYEGVSEVHFLAAYLILAIGKAHAFEQGNKRTAWAAGRLFIHNNGYFLEISEGSQSFVATMVEHLMIDENTVDVLIAWLGDHIHAA